VPRGFEEIALALHADEALAKNFFQPGVKMLFYAAASLAQPIWDQPARGGGKDLRRAHPHDHGLGMTGPHRSRSAPNWEAGQVGRIGHPAPGVEMRLVPWAKSWSVRYRGPT